MTMWASPAHAETLPLPADLIGLSTEDGAQLLIDTPSCAPRACKPRFITRKAAATDRFPILDVSRHKYPPVWVTTADLHAAMSAVDGNNEGKRQGFVVIRGWR